MAPLQVTVGDPDGLNVGSLIHAIEAGYRTADGRRVRVYVGQGVVVDGLTPGLLYLTPTSESE